ncbi:hypothetical protein LI328DRAFT_112967 [Trichoderma asperelloides]|nr:hypothetical protein LI328DRAFT_112967 [Trichoderma asperelloides]
MSLHVLSIVFLFRQTESPATVSHRHRISRPNYCRLDASSLVALKGGGQRGKTTCMKRNVSGISLMHNHLSKKMHTSNT